MDESYYEYESPAVTVLRTVGRVVGTIVLVMAVSFCIFACIFTAYLRNYLLPQVSFSLDGFRLNQTSVIYYENHTTGKYETLQNLYGDENRIWAPYNEIPPNLVYATVAIEDKRFFQHHGVDWYRSLRASVNLFVGSDSTYGASTLTQQLVKNLTQDDEVTVRRKLLEIFRALEMERKYEKDEILEWYLNTIYMGEQAYGVRTAAYTYFGKDVSELSLAECASLIGITNNPSRYDPYISEDTKNANKKRQLYILYEMLDQGYIESEEYEAAKTEPLVFTYAESDTHLSEDHVYYSYFEDQVIRDVVNDLAAQTGQDPEIVNQIILNGGYQIYSTVDLDLQHKLEEIYENTENIPGTESMYQQLQSGMVIIDNSTGDIVAMVGGVGEKPGSLTLNRATQSLLSPASTIKPIAVYAPALELGLITPATVYDDTPFSFGTTAWPKNEDETYHGLTNILTAMEKSTNTIAVKVLDDVGLSRAYNYTANEMGIDTLVDEYELNGVEYTDKSYWSLALGGMVNGVTIRDLTTAYASIANGGLYRQSRTYTKVVDSDGNVILNNEQSSRTVMSAKTAYYLTYMMQKTVEEGTGTEAAIDGVAVAGKTGTTSDNKDRWFAGYTTDYTAAVWCGYDSPQEIVLTDSDIDNPSCVLWRKVMTSISGTPGGAEFNKPSSMIEVEVCADSGKLPTELCQMDPRGDRTITIMLSAEDVPSDYCTMHVAAELCTAGENLHVANDGCAAYETVISSSLLNYNRQYPLSGIVVEDQQYCIGEQELEADYYEARSDTMDPVNEPCTIHTGSGSSSAFSIISDAVRDALGF